MPVSLETSRVKSFVIEQGTDLAGVADMQALVGIPSIPQELMEEFPRAVSFAIRLPDAAIDTVSTGPTQAYINAYQAANSALDAISSQVVELFARSGHKALPVAASRVVDWQNLRGTVPHQAVGRIAGLGWQGKSLLIVSPGFGPRLRLSTILTDMPLEPDVPIPNRCGECRVCVEACPAGAIKGVATRDHYRTAYDAMDLDKCHVQLKTFRDSLQLDRPSCGICIQVCPWGQKTRTDR